MMKVIIEEIVRRLHLLPEAKLLEVLDFVEVLTLLGEGSTSKQRGLEDKASLQEDEEFDALLDRLAHEFEACVGPNAPVLSDFAVSRAGIYVDRL
ncbi:hypothetical protein [Kamptonema formosum]|uniref:hypothetical protein n=1 Tax=Kamptonema formosum TaxID=331992 RepID=UPI0012DFB36F|nr:hypothetical protein [Oscillatoria sp. PCC 10802]